MGDLGVLGVDRDGHNNDFLSLLGLSRGGGFGSGSRRGWNNLGRTQVVEYTVEDGARLGLSASANRSLDVLREVPSGPLNVRFGSILGCDELETAYSEKGCEGGDGVGAHIEQFCT